MEVWYQFIDLKLQREYCMSRGRKGPPQEDIDGILLTMSRRMDLDPETLSYYFDRLDDKWTNGARDKVLQLLRTNENASQTTAVQNSF